jgi:hypothetical protein
VWSYYPSQGPPPQPGIVYHEIPVTTGRMVAPRDLAEFGGFFTTFLDG